MNKRRGVINYQLYSSVKMQNCHMSLKQSDFKGERVIKCKGTRTNNRRDEMRKAGVSTCKWDVNVKVESE